jgi:hypothetical protein
VVAMTAPAIEDDSVFDAASYKRHMQSIPSMDGYRAAKLELRFSGSGILDRTSADDIELLRVGGWASRFG